MSALLRCWYKCNSITGSTHCIFQPRTSWKKSLAVHVWEKKIIALVLTVQKWWPYLLSRKFIVRTDHRSLKDLWTQKITTITQQRWLYKLVGFDFEIEYKKWGDNVVADTLSKWNNMMVHCLHFHSLSVISKCHQGSTGIKLCYKGINWESLTK